jgi:NADPH:quinone reductase-like Zn-dependent oxidoreductase
MLRALSRGVEVTAGVRAGKEETALALGATHALAVDSPATAGAGPRRFDCILDAIGPETVSRWEESIVEGGLVTTIVPLPPAKFTRTDVEMLPFAMNANPDAIREAASLILRAGSNARAIETLALDETAKAHEVLLSGGGRKFVVVPNASLAEVRD